MTPEEYQQYKDAEKEHLKKLKELKRAVHVLERQKKIQASLRDMTQSTSEALDAQEEMVERMAQETALQEARLEVALDASESNDAAVPEDTEEDLKRERARLLVDQIKASLDAEERDPPSKTTDRERSSTERQTGEAPANPTKDRGARPEKTIGRM